MKSKNKKIIFAIFWAIFVLGVAGTSIEPVQAVTKPAINDTTYRAKYHSQSVADPVVIEAGATREVIIKFKNTGTATWNASGSRYVSAYTMEPKYRASQFSGTDWLSAAHPARIVATTKPGGVAEIKIKLHAPLKPGDYRENFWLAAEDRTWIDGGYFYLDVKVVSVKSAGSSVEDTTTVAPVVTENTGVVAALTMISSRKVTATVGGEKISFIVVYQNDGEKTWGDLSWREAGSSESAAGGVAINIADSSWLSQTEIYKTTDDLAPGQTKRIVFSFRAPIKAGSYTARFQLYADGLPIKGGDFNLPVSVTADAPANYVAPNFSTALSLIAEPRIRVGLFKSDVPLKFQSGSVYEIFAGEVKKGTLSAFTPATLSYGDGIYTFTSAELSFTGREVVRFVPYDINDHFEILSYERTVSWKSGQNYNKYRGILEYVYSPKSDMPYIINELLLDDYVAGIGETSNGAALEYIKAILVAARSYAYYYISHAGENDMFNVYPTTVDQLYLGYNSEVSMPRVVEAARATRGEMVHYGGEPVITPYFGNSDGRTRTWVEVWGGTDKPWLKSVPCKYDIGKNLWGHGVGMSAADAAARADKDGWTYQQLLKHYYTGVEVKRLY